MSQIPSEVPHFVSNGFLLTHFFVPFFCCDICIDCTCLEYKQQLFQLWRQTYFKVNDEGKYFQTSLGFIMTDVFTGSQDEFLEQYLERGRRI